jgi:hypothetical protein
MTYQTNSDEDIIVINSPEQTFCNDFNSYLSNKKSLNEVIQSYLEMDDIDQFKQAIIIAENMDEANIISIHDFIAEVLKQNSEFEEENKDVFCYFKFKIYLYLLKHKTVPKINQIDTSNKNSFLIKMHCLFCEFSNEKQIEVMHKIFFNRKDYISDANAFIFIKLTFDKTGGMEKYQFNQEFDKFIKNSSSKQFDDFFLSVNKKE